MAEKPSLICAIKHFLLFKKPYKIQALKIFYFLHGGQFPDIKKPVNFTGFVFIIKIFRVRSISQTGRYLAWSFAWHASHLPLRHNL